jgi:N-acetyl-gamma-glutamyl-phosphate reductase
MKKKIAIIGASGNTGGELIKLLSPYPGIELVALNSEGHAGHKVEELHPSTGRGLVFTNYSLAEINALKPDLVFLCRVAGRGRDNADQLDARIIDLSRDLRFAAGTVYGLPELFRRDIASARIVANPGCYATACILGAFPCVKNNLSERIVFDCKSGFSGAGQTPCYRNDPKNYSDNVIAYDISEHPHRDEIRQGLGFVNLSFTPHVLPLYRGILATIHVILRKKITGEEVRARYREVYAREPFVKIMDRVPELRDAQQTNYCCLGGFEVDDTGRLAVVATIDNLIKGASGQAVQNMNLMLGFPETEGLTFS